MDSQEQIVLPTVEDLDEIITHSTGGLITSPCSTHDEVYANIFVGDESFARNLVELQRMKITHVLNAAHGTEVYHVNTNHSMYNKVHITFKGIEATDHMNFDLYPFFHECADFIKGALESGGKVLVHCIQGVSRSVTLVLAYLMLKERIHLKDALRLVRSQREVCPNTGFLQQLIKLEKELKQADHYDSDD